ncbi:MAG TPA: hypothetical protein VGU66_05915 [Candidatus Elarobacter sp.]|nr:hypothetical protein [Candidatus Elarobacter sp.]
MPDDAEGSPMERFENLLGRIISAGKKDVRKVEQAAEEIVDEALGPPPAKGPALADED